MATVAAPEIDLTLAPMVLYGPAHIKATEHVIKKGDTLWDISKLYTGDPFNFPLVAESNRIVNPDLIYPGQHISILPSTDYNPGSSDSNNLNQPLPKQ